MYIKVIAIKFWNDRLKTLNCLLGQHNVLYQPMSIKKIYENLYSAKQENADYVHEVQRQARAEDFKRGGEKILKIDPLRSI